MALLPKVKLKALVSFPATILDGTGVDVVKANGTYQFNLDFADFAPPVGGVSDPAHANALLWDDITGTYSLVPLSVLVSGGAVSEAPNDGIQYGRQSLAWTPVISGGVAPATTPPLADGVAAVGVSLKYAREDHVHPAGAAGSGDVTGPASAVADNIAVFDGITGKIIKDGGATIATLAPLASPTFTGDPKAPTPTAGDNDTTIATTAFVTAAVAAGGGGGSTVLRSYLAGLTLSWVSGTTFGIAAGVATNSTNSVMMTLASAFTKTTGTWTAGTGNGALDTGATITASTWYHVFLIRNPTTDVADVCVSASLTPTDRPITAGFTQYRRIGSMRTAAGSLWMEFTQVGEQFFWATILQDVNGTAVGTGGGAFTLAYAPPNVEAILGTSMVSNTVGTSLAFYSFFTNTMTTAFASGYYTHICLAASVGYGAVLRIQTDSTRRIRAISNATAATCAAYVNVIGWIDRRGRDD